MMVDRYYVQRLTEQVFLIRECLSADGKPGSNDRIVRSFDIRHDAYMYADSVTISKGSSMNTTATGLSPLYERRGQA